MATLNEQIAKTMETLEQLKRKQKLQEQKEKKARLKSEKLRNLIIGEIFSRTFPNEVARFRPRCSKAENQLEFELLENFMIVLATNKELVESLKAEAGWEVNI